MPFKAWLLFFNKTIKFKIMWILKNKTNPRPYRTHDLKDKQRVLNYVASVETSLISASSHDWSWEL